MEIGFGHSELSIILQVSTVKGCPFALKIADYIYNKQFLHRSCYINLALFLTMVEIINTMHYVELLRILLD